MDGAMTERTGRLALPGLMAWPLLAAGLAALVWGGFQIGRQSGAVRITSAGPRIEDVRAIAKLAVLRVQVASIIEGANAGAEGVVLVHGDADIAVDLDAIAIVERDDAARRAVVELPTPRPERPRVNHERTRLYDLRKTGLAAINPFADPRADLLADCMRAAQAEVERAVVSPDFVMQAKSRAEVLLAGFYRQTGWDVTIRWQ